MVEIPDTSKNSGAPAVSSSVNPAAPLSRSEKKVNKANSVITSSKTVPSGVEKSLVERILKVIENAIHALLGYDQKKAHQMVQAISHRVEMIVAQQSPFIQKKEMLALDKVPTEIPVSLITEEERVFFRYMIDHIDWETLPDNMSRMDVVREVLQGAYCIIDDGGASYDSWVGDFQNKIGRYSSHASDSEQYAIRGVVAKEMLFSTKMWEEKGRKVTWFQLERYPAGGLNHIPHLWTYILYKITGMNMGPLGQSEHREGNKPLVLRLK